MLARLDAARAGRRGGRRRRADAGRDEQARAGARAARAGRPRDPGQPAAHGAGARRVLPRQRQARGARVARQGQPADPRRAARSSAWTTPTGCSRCARSRSSATRTRSPGRQRRPRAAGRIAVGPGLLHRGGRAAASRSRPPDRAADRASAWARRPRPPRPRTESVEAAVARAARRAARARRPRCAARRPTPPRAKRCKQKLDGIARRCRADRRRRPRRAGRRGAEGARGRRRRRVSPRPSTRSPTPAAPAPEISEETQRLLATDAHELDRELLEIYLTEAARGARNGRRATAQRSTPIPAIAKRSPPCAAASTR